MRKRRLCDSVVVSQLLVFRNLVTKLSSGFTMADENGENGVANGDVPEIELIIKVNNGRLVAVMAPSNFDNFLGITRWNCKKT